jgi:type VI secretion system protein ImpA
MDLTELLAPISAASPAGVSLRGEYLYRQIELARVEEDEAPQGEWTRARKTADPAQVVHLATDVLARQSKDLQVAAWLTEAWTLREGLAGLAAGLRLVHDLMDRFWEHLYPELEFDDPEREGGDPELRAAPLEWMDHVLPAAVRAVPLTRAGHGAQAYEDARALGYEKAVKGDGERHQAWLRAVENGRLSADAFDRALAQTRADWLVERRAEAQAAQAALEALRRLCSLRFDRDAPRFLALRGALEGVEQLAGQLLERKQAGLEAAPASAAAAADAPPAAPSAEAPAVQPVPPRAEHAAATAEDVPESAPGGPPADVPPAPAEDVPGDSAGAPRSRGEAAARVAALARWLRAQDPADPAPYLMVRGFRWGELRAGGPLPDPRLLPAPPTGERVRLRTLALEERWAELLEAAEEATAAGHGRGWLDLQRYAATACEALGPAYDAVRQATAGALRALLHDLPALPGLTLMDDTPAANRETLAWLRESGIAPADGDAEAAYPAPRTASAEERARARAAAGEPDRAVAILLDAGGGRRGGPAPRRPPPPRPVPPAHAGGGGDGGGGAGGRGRPRPAGDGGAGAAARAGGLGGGRGGGPPPCPALPLHGPAGRRAGRARAPVPARVPAGPRARHPAGRGGGCSRVIPSAPCGRPCWTGSWTGTTPAPARRGRGRWRA